MILNTFAKILEGAILLTSGHDTNDTKTSKTHAAILSKILDTLSLGFQHFQQIQPIQPSLAGFCVCFHGSSRSKCLASWQHNGAICAINISPSNTWSQAFELCTIDRLCVIRVCIPSLCIFSRKCGTRCLAR